MNGIMYLVIAVIMTFFGFALSITGNIYCETIQFDSNSVGKSFEFPPLTMGLWSVRRKALFVFDPIYDDPFWTVGNICVDYPKESKFDTKWESAKALSITSWVLGGLAFIALSLGLCMPPLRSKGKPLGFLLLVITLFQGLSLLIHASDGCDADMNPVFLKFPSLHAYYEDQCSMSTGSKMNVAAIVMYFLAAMALIAMPPAAPENDYDGDAMPGEKLNEEDVEVSAKEEQPLAVDDDEEAK